MDNDRLIPANRRAPAEVVALVYPRLCLFEFGIAAELFGLARPELGVAWYTFKAAMTTRSVRSGIGDIRMATDGGLELLESAQTIVIPGWSGVDVLPSPALRTAVCDAHARGARLLSICSGAFLLGHCGLLDGRNATTHWRYESMFRERFPKATLLADALYVQSDRIITSAGSAAGIDAGLHLIRQDFGTAVANAVAQRLVMPPHREGGQRQFVPAPVPDKRQDLFDGVFQWTRERLATPLTVADMAAAAAMSERNFHRRFGDTVGMTPARWLLQERVHRAKLLLETGELTLEQVGAASGFASPETFRAAFRRAVGASPSAYRSAFGAR